MKNNKPENENAITKEIKDRKKLVEVEDRQRRSNLHIIKISEEEEKPME